MRDEPTSLNRGERELLESVGYGDAITFPEEGVFSSVDAVRSWFDLHPDARKAYGKVVVNEVNLGVKTLVIINSPEPSTTYFIRI